jgi:hypothetical protein
VTPPPHEPPSYDELDPFDLPEWLGEREITWGADAGLLAGHRVTGTLTADDGTTLDCDLLAVDDAYPEPVAADPVRVRAHQVWSSSWPRVTASSSPCQGRASTPRPHSPPSAGWPAPSAPRPARTASVSG